MIDFFFIACQHAMHVERDIAIVFQSVRLPLQCQYCV